MVKIFIMKKINYTQLASSFETFHLPRYNELPQSGLYLEQTTQYINGYLAPLGCDKLTTSMVSNYVKKKFISSPVKKHYYAEHIIYLFFIALAKSIIPMDQINLLFDMQKQAYTDQIAYDYFCAEFENVFFHCLGLKEELDNIGVTSTDTKLMLRHAIIAIANTTYLNLCMREATGEEV